MKFSVFILAILLFASCATTRTPLTESDKERIRQIENPLERWRAYDFRNYNYGIRFIGGLHPFGGEYKVFVKDSKVLEVVDVRNGNIKVPKSRSIWSIFSEDNSRNFYTLDELTAHAQDEENDKNITINYNLTYGYLIYYLDGGEEYIDCDEFGYEVTFVEFLD